MTATRLLEHWLAPPGAGAPVACLATTFTFDATFFSEDCLVRFLGLGGVLGEGDRSADIAALIEEEERLSETSIVVLTDRSAATEPRNLRWDVLGVAVDGGLLHAKVAVLLWEHATRVLIGSANLTTAGYRNQVEIALAIDLDPGSRVPRVLLAELSGELRALVALAPGSDTERGPKARAGAILQQLDERVAAAALPVRQSGTLAMALAPAAPGRSPLTALDSVWVGARPRGMTALSPFWDTQPHLVSRTITSLEGRLATKRRNGEPCEAAYIVPVVVESSLARAPREILDHARSQHIEVRCAAFLQPEPNEFRRLHAKCLAYESDDWLAVLIGSSNMTAAGLGLDEHYGHREINVWIGCPAESRDAAALRELLCEGDPLDPAVTIFEAEPPDDEPTSLPLPVGFEVAEIEAVGPVRLRLEFRPASLPASWSIETLDRNVLLTDATWAADQSPTIVRREVPGTPILPSVLRVSWETPEGTATADWSVNMIDPGLLPPPSDLQKLPTRLILAVLASTRPLRAAFEEAHRRYLATPVGGEDILDPLRMHDGSARMLLRTREWSAALWGLRTRLGRPIGSIETLESRLAGVLGPTTLADRLIDPDDASLLPGETEFLLAEIALTVADVDWTTAARKVPIESVRGHVAGTLAGLRARYAAKIARGACPVPIRAYADAAFLKATP